MRLVLTGGCGFIGHHTVEHLLKNTDWEIVILDKLGYASKGFERLRNIEVYDDKRVKVFTYDFTVRMEPGLAKEIGPVDYIIHMGAETHVDNSITNPLPFVRSNILGTFEMLQWARSIDSLKLFVYFSTDEVFGPAPQGVNYKEWDRYNSTNPYSATKAGGEELVLAWSNTYGLPVAITHTMNAFGERQHPEKFIPSTIRKVLESEKVTIHADATKTVSGTRFYIHCRNIASAILHIIKFMEGGVFAGVKKEKFNIVGEKEVSNLALAQFIAEYLGMKLYYEMVDFHSSRPGHDLRYALDGSFMRSTGWTPPKNFEESLGKTIQWYLEPQNKHWLYSEKWNL